MTEFKPAIIVDLDGTVANTEHRLHHLMEEPKDWAAFKAAMIHDIPVNYVIELVRAMHKYGVAVFVFTAREQDTRSLTMQQLRSWKVPYSRLLMRQVGDTTPDEALKLSWLKQIHEHHNVLFAIEDRPEVVQMWRDNAVPCFAVDQEQWVNQVWLAAIDDAIQCLTAQLKGYGHVSFQDALDELRGMRSRGPACKPNASTQWQKDADHEPNVNPDPNYWLRQSHLSQYKTETGRGYHEEDVGDSDEAS